MIDKKLLKEQQPVAYRTLSHALHSGRLSHAYLFYGSSGSIKSRLALLTVQSLFCPNCDEDGFACQECESCRRIANEENPDVYWLHNGGMRRAKPLTRKELDAWWKQNQVDIVQKKWTIRKEDILALQDAFATSALTSSHRQAYILEQYDQATPSASNSLLKFLEEPKEGLFGILIADELSSILPTIVSRCQLIPFRSQSREAARQELQELIDDDQLVAILAAAGYDLAQAGSLLEEEAAFEIRDAAKEYWAGRTSHLALINLQTGVFAKNAKLSRHGVKFFLHCLLYFLEEEHQLDALHLDLRLILLEGIDALRLPLDPSLLLERVCLQIMQRSAVR